MLKKTFFFAFFLVLLHSSLCQAVTVMNPRRDIYVSPGGNAKTEIKVINETSKDQTIKVYLTDYKHFSNGRVAYPEPGSTPRSNANWIKFSPANFTIRAGTALDVQVELNAPRGDLTGTYWSMLMFEFVDENQEIKNVEGDVVSQARTVRRQAVHLRSHITGTGVMQARISNRRIENLMGKKMLCVDLENTGTLFYRGDFWIEIFNKEGYPIGKVSNLPRGAYPGSSIKLQADVSHLKKGKYTALFVFDTRDNKVFGAKYDIEIP